MQIYCTFLLFVNQHFPGIFASGTHCRNKYSTTAGQACYQGRDVAVREKSVSVIAAMCSPLVGRKAICQAPDQNLALIISYCKDCTIDHDFAKFICYHLPLSQCAVWSVRVNVRDITLLSGSSSV
jgi:hypothetical protein